jgi:uracil-DNA glycosylase family 4
MANDFQHLLDATITHLEDLKARGDRFIPLNPATLKDLARVPARLPSAPMRPPSASPAPVTEPRPTPTAAPAPAPQAPARSRPTPDPSKDMALAELRERALACTRCPNLVSFRKQVVFGVGNSDADLMFVGEAPGADEDAQGEPFVGRAGQLITRIIETMGLSRDTVYIGNVLKCRPDVAAGATGNRKPTPEEMKTCLPWLLDQIEIIQPKVLVALGATAVEGLIGGTVKITHMRGQWKEFKGIPLMPTFHPSYLLRGNDINKKRQVWEDMLQVMEKLEMPVSEKQRGFFLNR